MWFVYIIHSPTHDIYYKGESERPYLRLDEHNNNLSNFTAFKGPWTLVYLEQVENRTAAIKKEKMLKRQNRRYILWLIEQPTNLLKRE